MKYIHRSLLTYSKETHLAYLRTCRCHSHVVSLKVGLFQVHKMYTQVSFDTFKRNICGVPEDVQGPFSCCELEVKFWHRLPTDPNDASVMPHSRCIVVHVSLRICVCMYVSMVYPCVRMRECAYVSVSVCVYVHVSRDAVLLLHSIACVAAHVCVGVYVSI